MSDCQICGHDIDNHGRSGCCMHKCSCLRTHSHADHPSYAEQDARIAALTERAERAEKANALLRAECEAWRDQARIEGDGCTALMSEDEASKWGSAVIQAYNKLIDARAATDAAGALKGVG